MGLLLFQKLFPALGTSADGRGRGRGLLLLCLLGLVVRDQLPCIQGEGEVVALGQENPKFSWNLITKTKIDARYKDLTSQEL